MKVRINDKKNDFINRKMFGLFFEDINYAGDGGLYAEMIENRQFAFKKATVTDIEKQYATENTPGYGWMSEDGEMTYRSEDPLSKNNPYYLVFTAKGDKASFTNKAYDGVYLSKGHTYQALLWVRVKEDEGNIALKINDQEYLHFTVEKRERWKMLKSSFTADEDIEKGIFVIEQENGTVEYAYISLMDENAVEGVFRKDLFDVLDDLKPGFLRFPGGCIVEGADLSNRYRWKDTIGEPWDRTWNWSRWCVHDIHMGNGESEYFSYTNQSYGIGFYEYFLLCERLDCEPLPVVNVGLACQFQSDEMVDIHSEEFDEYIQDALDLVEFANGDESTVWGKVRCDLGHPQPFDLKYLGIGNEQWETEKVDFLARYDAFEKAVHDKYPRMKLIGSAGPFVDTKEYHLAWNYYRKKMADDPAYCYAVDEHYYMPAEWFYTHETMYDAWDRRFPVFAGEYACHLESKENTWEAALAEASFMCGLERNGDVIAMASTAPLLARKNYAHWKPDLIWFDGNTVTPTPSYDVQKMFSCYTGSASVNYEIDGKEEGLYSSVSMDEDHIYVKLINASDHVMYVDEIMIKDEIKEISETFVMHGELNDYDVSLKEMKTENTDIVLDRYSASVFVFDI